MKRLNTSRSIWESCWIWTRPLVAWKRAYHAGALIATLLAISQGCWLGCFGTPIGTRLRPTGVAQFIHKQGHHLTEMLPHVPQSREQGGFLLVVSRVGTEVLGPSMSQLDACRAHKQADPCQAIVRQKAEAR